MIRHTYISPDGIPYVGYGIAGKSIEITDLSTDGAAVRAFVRLCNRLKLQDESLREAAEDFLASEMGNGMQK